ncbi:BON domain-containing protein [Psychromonas aquimarina]|uniref:BON domain-containing protein n=1 Tax=Psychromonas aquimarina TaxID=444919 RepID=UPI00041105D4|nr:BON domain-containing protein [Psychromonas aquimarina]
MKKILPTLFLAAVFPLIQGCAGGLIVAAGAAVALNSDERSVSQQLSDEELSVSALDKLNQLKLDDKKMRINFISNSGYLLVVGQVENQDTRSRIEEQLNTIEEAKGVYNQLRIMPPISFTQQTKDTWITTKVKSQLTAHDKVDPLKIKVLTENAEVFLVGKVTREMADDATNVSRKVDGVKQVNRVFQFIEEKPKTDK